MKKSIIFLLLIFLSVNAYATKVTLFIDIDTYVKRSKDIIIAKALDTSEPEKYEDLLCPIHVEILKVLKGNQEIGETRISTIYSIKKDCIYLLSSIGGSAFKTNFLAIPELSVVKIPEDFNLDQLVEKSLREQIRTIFTVRYNRLKNELHDLQKEKELLERALSPSKDLPQWHTSPNKWESPRIYNSKFDRDFENRIIISTIGFTEDKINFYDTKKQYSSNKAYWFIINSPDTKKPAPWSTKLLIFNERDYLIEIHLKDHDARYNTKIEWINEKLLYVQLWWGRVVGTYFIYDVEKEEIITKEMVYEGSIPYQQFQKKDIK